MKHILGFLRAVHKMPQPWPVWFWVLVLVNAVGPLFFLGTTEGKTVLGSILVSGLAMLGLFAAFGFVRLLGLAHLPLLVLVPWLWFRLDVVEPFTPLYFGIVTVMAVDAFSLVFDITDVARWLAGDRAPTVSPD